MRRFMKGQRTRLFALLVGVLGIVELYDDEIVRGLVPAPYQGLVLMGIAIGILLLRQITTTPAGGRY